MASARRPPSSTPSPESPLSESPERSSSEGPASPPPLSDVARGTAPRFASARRLGRALHDHCLRKKPLPSDVEACVADLFSASKQAASGKERLLDAARDFARGRADICGYDVCELRRFARQRAIVDLGAEQGHRLHVPDAAVCKDGRRARLASSRKCRRRLERAFLELALAAAFDGVSLARAAVRASARLAFYPRDVLLRSAPGTWLAGLLPLTFLSRAETAEPALEALGHLRAASGGWHHAWTPSSWLRRDDESTQILAGLKQLLLEVPAWIQGVFAALVSLFGGSIVASLNVAFLSLPAWRLPDCRRGAYSPDGWCSLFASLLTTAVFHWIAAATIGTLPLLDALLPHLAPGAAKSVDGSLHALRRDYPWLASRLLPGHAAAAQAERLRDATRKHRPRGDAFSSEKAIAAELVKQGLVPFQLAAAFAETISACFRRAPQEGPEDYSALFALAGDLSRSLFAQAGGFMKELLPQAAGDLVTATSFVLEALGSRNALPAWAREAASKGGLEVLAQVSSSSWADAFFHLGRLQELWPLDPGTGYWKAAVEFFATVASSQEDVSGTRVSPGAQLFVAAFLASLSEGMLRCKDAVSCELALQLRTRLLEAELEQLPRTPGPL